MTRLRNHTLLSEKEFHCANAGETRRRIRAHWPKEPNDDNLLPANPLLTASLVPRSISGTPADVAHGKHDGLPHGDRTIHRQSGLTVIILCNRTDLEPEEAGDADCRSNFQRTKSSAVSGDATNS